jgi:arabinan endo-1,5-alpha-L-arabinosidase
MAAGGGTLFLAAQGNDIGPGHFGLLLDDGVEKFSCHYEADLQAGGRSVLDIRPLLWTADGWPMPGQDIKDGTYQVRSQRTGTVLQLSTNLALTDLYLVHNNQKWNISSAGGGTYKITNVAGGKALTATKGMVDFAPFTGADDQLWKIDQLSDATYRIASITGHLALTSLSKARPGNRFVKLQPFNGDDNQHWILTAP